MKEDKGKPNVKPEIEEIFILGYVTKVIDDEKGEYEMLFKPNIFGNVKNMEELK